MTKKENAGRKPKYSESEIDATLMKFIAQCIEENQLPTNKELGLTEEGRKILYSIYKRHAKRKKFIEESNLLAIGRNRKTDFQELQDFVKTCRERKQIPTTYELTSTEVGNRLYYLIYKHYGSKKKFAEANGLVDLYKRNFKGRKIKITDTVLEKLKTKVTKILLKKSYQFGSQKVTALEQKEIQSMGIKELSGRWKFSYRSILEEAGIEKVPKHFLDFLKSIDREKKKQGMIDIAKRNREILKSDKLRPYLYARYKRQPLINLLKEYGLENEK